MRNAQRNRGWASVMVGAIVMMCAPAVAADAQIFSLAYTFTGYGNGYPYDSLVPDATGNLYGTARGTNGSAAGVVFKLDSTGHETVLHTFSTPADGQFPYSTLVRDSAGNLYGTTPSGGTYGSSCEGGGCGVVFKISPAGNETVLYRFAGGVDGDYPSDGPGGGLVRDSEGNLYGTANFGGHFNGICPGYGCGVVYKIDSLGNYSVLYTFTGAADGAYPHSGVVRDSVGNLYGVTFGGGQGSCYGDGSGCGVVYKIDPAGGESVLYSFTGGADGSDPEGALVLDSVGNLYGTAADGGTFGGACSYPYGCGVVFKIDPAGNETALYSFSGGLDGGTPASSVIRDKSGNLYGTTLYGGTYGLGTVFRLSASGGEFVIHSFTGGADGDDPWGRLLVYRDYLYGTTVTGGPQGTSGPGVIYKVKLP